MFSAIGKVLEKMLERRIGRREVRMPNLKANEVKEKLNSDGEGKRPIETPPKIANNAGKDDGLMMKFLSKE